MLNEIDHILLVANLQTNNEKRHLMQVHVCMNMIYCKTISRSNTDNLIIHTLDTMINFSVSMDR